MQRLKILYYNWADFDDPELRGGGVSIYQRNLVDAATQRGDEVWFFRSGLSYSLFTRRPFLRRVRTSRPGVRKFDLVNSALFSPGQEAFGQDVGSAPEMEEVFADFLREHGPFDVVHFNNLEGIPVSFLRLARQHHPAARVLYSLHNYFAFCPQVNLWFQERATCKDFQGGKKCVNCLVRPLNTRGTRRFYQVDYTLRRLGVAPATPLYRAATWLIHTPVFRGIRGVKLALWAALGRKRPPKTRPPAILDAEAADRFARRRRLFVDALNAHADCVLAVSGRVAELAVGFGLDPHKVRTLYIGTRFAHARPACERAPGPEGVLRIAYLGYMRHDKGFYFYLKALERMPAPLARRLGLVFAARVTDEGAYQWLRRMAHRFASVTFHDGYTHAQLPRILAEVDLGIVPVLWEDNLPQVAIECVGSGIPILTSDAGGARELLGCPELVFRARSRSSLYARLQAILADPSILRTALAGRARLFTPDEHYDRLREEFYAPTPAEGARAQAPRTTLCPTP
jgi:glycosyltransferase involved in cell wall biosynthesis